MDSAQSIEIIPVNAIDVVNPRVRNRRIFREIVTSVAELGLKRPITVKRKQVEGDQRYDLICGQGRLEAYQSLGQREIPAIVISASDEDSAIMSLVENCARRQHRAIDLLHDIEGLKNRGYEFEEIARKTGLTVEYVRGVAGLLENGEHRLLRAVEAGLVPVSVAVLIAQAEDSDVQAVLQQAYEEKLLRGQRLILKAVENGVSEERIAKSLNVDVGSIRRRRKLLDGICAEAAELLKEKHIALNTFSELRKMGAIRQIEAAELMVAMNNFSNSYVRSLVAATPKSQLTPGYQPRAPKGLSDEQLALMERESASLAREFKVAEQTYGADHLDLVLANGYVSKLLRNGRVVGYLAKNYQELLFEFQKITEAEVAAA